MSLIIKETSLIYILIISAFGPYLFPSIGIRVDHLFIYGIFILLVIFNKVYFLKDFSISFILILLVVLFLLPFVNSITAVNIISSSLFVAQIENYLQPLIIFLIFASLMPIKIDELDNVFNKGLEIIIWLAAFNTIFSIYTFLNPDTSLIRFFSGTRIIDHSVLGELTNAELNLSAGKSIGIFSQTYSVGFLYAFSILGWGYLYRNENTQKIKNFFLLSLLLIGGLISFSKIFLVIGIPLFVFFVGLKKFIYIFIPILLAILIIISFNSSIIETIRDYEAMKYIYRLIVGFTSGDIVNIFTSGRLSEDSIIFPNIINILSTNTFFGLGYGSIETSDFAFYEIISLGGLFSLFAYTFLLIIVIVPIFNLRSLKDKYFYSFFIILCFLSSLAAPIFTANRISIIIWFVIVYFFYKIFKLKTL